MIDFESASRNAFCKAAFDFNKCQIGSKSPPALLNFDLASGCNFHFKKDVGTKIRSITKLFMYGKMYFLLYLSYMPSDLIMRIFRILKSHGEFDGLPKIDIILAYFERTWVGRYVDTQFHPI